LHTKHRLSTIRNADTIAVVMGGTIVETGTHDELMSQNDTYYKKLVDTQKNAMAEGTGTNGSMMKTNSSISSVPSSLLTNFSGPSESQLGFDKVPIKFHESGAQPLIVFRNVSFSYPTRPNKLILDRFKLKIYKGETIGLCGISGGGKSTVMGLIERFYDPHLGQVEYFGNNIQHINVKWYRDQIGYVGTYNVYIVVVSVTFIFVYLVVYYRSVSSIIVLFSPYLFHSRQYNAHPSKQLCLFRLSLFLSLVQRSRTNII
jgi:ATP-binding cassette subfamily B (MDR/TAP) protein 1